MKRLRYAGFKKESIFGTPEDSAEFHVDIASSSLDTPSDAEMVYQGGMGRGNTIRRPGFYSPSGSIDYVVDIETIAQVMKWTLGGYNYTEPNHEIYGTQETTLDSFTAFVGKDAFEHEFAGCIIDGLQLSVDNEFVEISLDILAAKDDQNDLKEVSELELPDAYPMTFAQVKVNMGGDISADVKNLTLDISNNADASDGQGMGSRHPERIIANNREVTLSMSLYFEDTTHLESFHGSDSGPDNEDGADSETVTLTFETADPTDDKEMEIELPDAFISEINLQPSGTDELTEEITLTAMQKDDATLDSGTEVATDIIATINDGEGDMS